MPTAMEKDEAHKLIDRMPPDATWDDLMREIYVRGGKMGTLLHC